MIHIWILISLALLSSGNPQNRELRRRNRHPGRNIIFFPGEVNSNTEENYGSLEESYSSPDDEDSYANLEPSRPSNFITEEDYVELPDWMDIDLNELPLDKLEALNNATDLTDLVEFFGLDYENAAKLSGRSNRTQSDLEVESRPRSAIGSLEVESRPRSDIRSLEVEPRPRSATGIVEKSDGMAKFAKCIPREEPVVLAVSKNALHLPSCVSLKRCGGCCNSDLLSCQPTEVELVSLMVLKISKGRRRQRRSSRSRRQSRKRRVTSGKMVSILEENHVECSCQCIVQEQHCAPSLHNYNKDICSCVCKDEAEQRKCEKSKVLHYWDNDTCSCKCMKVTMCGTGELFSHQMCRCLPALT